MSLMCFGLAVGTTPANAVGSYNNASIADIALTKIGQYGGQCKTFANNMVKQASGNTQWPAPGYHSGFANAGGIEVSSQNAAKGDVIQIGNSDYDYPLHTAIIVTNKGGGNFNVVDSNWGLNEIVMQHDFNPYAWAPSGNVKIWRMGTVQPSSPAAIKTVNTDYNRDGTPDLYSFQRNDTGSNSTAVRIINGANPNQWLLQSSTILGQTGPETDFAVDDYNRDGIPDLYSFQRNEAGSNSTAVRIINGANPNQWLLQSGTILGQTDSQWSFSLGDYNQDGTPDIYAFNRNDAGTGKTSVHIINGANPSQWLLQAALVLGATSATTEFGVGDYNRDGTPDIYAITRNDGGSNSTAVRIINGANVSQWLLQTGTILSQTSDIWDFKVADYNRDSIPDLYAFNRNDVGSGSTSVHIVNGANFGSWLLQSGTILSPTSSMFSFS